MHNIAPFVPKIIEHLPDGRRLVYKDYDDYVENRLTVLTNSVPAYRCAYCEEKLDNDFKLNHSVCINRYHYHLKNRPPLDRLVGEADDEFEERVRKEARSKSNHVKGALYAKVTNELGDTVSHEFRYRGGDSLYNNWMEGRNSPLNRGVPERDRLGNEWMKKYRVSTSDAAAYGWCRRPKTTNERRQYAASIVDEFSPAIRAKRKANSIVHSWDEISHHLERSWKKEKVKKQWMVNL